MQQELLLIIQVTIEILGQVNVCCMLYITCGRVETILWFSTRYSCDDCEVLYVELVSLLRDDCEVL